MADTPSKPSGRVTRLLALFESSDERRRGNIDSEDGGSGSSSRSILRRSKKKKKSKKSKKSSGFFSDDEFQSSGRRHSSVPSAHDGMVTDVEGLSSGARKRKRLGVFTSVLKRGISVFSDTEAERDDQQVPPMPEYSEPAEVELEPRDDGDGDDDMNPLPNGHATEAITSGEPSTGTLACDASTHSVTATGDASGDENPDRSASAADEEEAVAHKEGKRGKRREKGERFVSKRQKKKIMRPAGSVIRDKQGSDKDSKGEREMKREKETKGAKESKRDSAASNMDSDTEPAPPEDDDSGGVRVELRAHPVGSQPPLDSLVDLSMKKRMSSKLYHARRASSKIGPEQQEELRVQLSSFSDDEIQQKLKACLGDEWNLGLFRQFLQQRQADGVVGFYLEGKQWSAEAKAAKEYRKYVRARKKVGDEQAVMDRTIRSREELRTAVYYLACKFDSDYTPKSVRQMLVNRVLVPAEDCRASRDTPAANTFKREVNTARVLKSILSEAWAVMNEEYRRYLDNQSVVHVSNLGDSGGVSRASASDTNAGDGTKVNAKEQPAVAEKKVPVAAPRVAVGGTAAFLKSRMKKKQQTEQSSPSSRGFASAPKPTIESSIDTGMEASGEMDPRDDEDRGAVDNVDRYFEELIMQSEFEDAEYVNARPTRRPSDEAEAEQELVDHMDDEDELAPFVVPDEIPLHPPGVKMEAPGVRSPDASEAKADQERASTSGAADDDVEEQEERPDDPDDHDGAAEDLPFVVEVEGQVGMRGSAALRTRRLTMAMATPEETELLMGEMDGADLLNAHVEGDTDEEEFVVSDLSMVSPRAESDDEIMEEEPRADGPGREEYEESDDDDDDIDMPDGYAMSGEEYSMSSEDEGMAEKWKDLSYDPFEEVDSPDNIVVGDVDEEGNEVIDAATLYKLVQRCTGEKRPSGRFLHVMVLMYAYYFRSPESFIRILQHRFNRVTAVPRGLSPQELAEWQRNLMLPRMLRVINVIKMWIDVHPHQFQRSPELAEQIRLFVRESIEPCSNAVAINVLSHLKRKLAEDLRPAKLHMSTRPPKPKIAKLKGLDFEDITMEVIHPVEFARQLTLIDERLYRAIHPSECLKQAWTKASKRAISPNVLEMIKQFCDVGLWVVTQLVTEVAIERRCGRLAKFIQIAYECVRLRNWNGAMAILSGLQNSSVYRLRETWYLLPSLSWDLWEEIKPTFQCDDNFALLRAALNESSTPTIPYLGMFLSDLTFIDSETDFVDENPNLVNFVKMRYIADILQRMSEFVVEPYCLEPVPVLQEFLMNLKTLPEPELFQHSIAREARRMNAAGEPIERRPPKTKAKTGSWMGLRKKSVDHERRSSVPDAELITGRKRKKGWFTKKKGADSEAEDSSQAVSGDSSSEMTGRAQSHELASKSDGSAELDPAGVASSSPAVSGGDVERRSSPLAREAKSVSDSD